MRMKKNIYLAQVHLVHKTPLFYTTYFPYAVGDLWAYAKQEPAINDSYELQEFLFLREPVKDAIERIKDPFFIGFSCYCWSTEYNKALAQEVKKRFPNCLILFGGHNVPPGEKMLEDLPYVDFLIHGEGEIPFRSLLTELAKESPDFSAVPGLSYRNGTEITTNPEAVLPSVEDLPSPYLEGLFDPLVAAHPEIQWSTVWETNRGCPYRCAYCDWGQQNARIRKFTMERLMAEIAWFGANKVEFIWCSDANFGILERDEELLDAMAASKADTGYPIVFLCQSTKTVTERLFRIAEKLTSSGLDSLGPNFAVQSLSPEVLRNIGRKNLDDETIAELIRRYRQAGYRSHTDLILGLPGETLQSFCAGVEKLFSLGQHGGIFFFHCNILPNATMGDPAFIEKYGIRTTQKIMKEVLDNVLDKDNPIIEYYDMVVETAAMPRADWLTANHFMFLTGGAHGFGILRLIAMFLHTENIVPYAEFYLRLLDFCNENPNTLVGEAITRIKNYFHNVQGDEADVLRIPGFSFGRITEIQYFFSCAALDSARFYDDITSFLLQFNLDPHLFEQLLLYQRESVLLPGASKKTLDFDYDFAAYFSAIYNGTPIPLKEERVRLQFYFPYDLSTIERYFDNIVRLGRMSDNMFYQVEYFPLED